MWWKKIAVRFLEYACGLNDTTLGRIPLPASWLDKDWRWMNWIYGCRLAGLSAALDERWGTEIWGVPVSEVDSAPPSDVD